MSNNANQLSTDKALAREYVLELSKIDDVTAVNVGGSRSPKSANEARPDSDWDFHVITANTFKLPQPTQWGLLGEAHCFPTSREKDVEVWPTDQHGLIT